MTTMAPGALRRHSTDIKDDDDDDDNDDDDDDENEQAHIFPV